MKARIKMRAIAHRLDREVSGKTSQYTYRALNRSFGRYCMDLGFSPDKAEIRVFNKYKTVYLWLKYQGFWAWLNLYASGRFHNIPIGSYLGKKKLSVVKVLLSRANKSFDLLREKKILDDDYIQKAVKELGAES